MKRDQNQTPLISKTIDLESLGVPQSHILNLVTSLSVHVMSGWRCSRLVSMRADTGGLYPLHLVPISLDMPRHTAVIARVLGFDQADANPNPI